MIELVIWVVSWVFVCSLLALALIFYGIVCSRFLNGQNNFAPSLFAGGWCLGLGVRLGVQLLTFRSDQQLGAESGFLIGMFLWGVAVGIGSVVYFVPTIVASERSHPNAVAILALNVFLGWSFFGWVAALVWSLTNTNAQTNFRMDRRRVITGISSDDAKVACRKCGRRFSPGLICSDGSCQQCYKPSLWG